VAKVKADGTGLDYAGFIGGDKTEAGCGIGLDPDGNAYVAGWTRSAEDTFPIGVGPDRTYNGLDVFVAKVSEVPPSCALSALQVQALIAVKAPTAPDDIEMRWEPDPVANGYNIWYVLGKEDLPFARQSSAPPAIPVSGCAVPSPASGTVCIDAGAVSRDPVLPFFYQVRVYCDPATEGP
jgi:hypothetical protein